MSANIVTYWWFDPDPVESGYGVYETPVAVAPVTALQRKGPPPFEHTRALGVGDAIDALIADKAKARGASPTSEDIGVSILSVVERLADGRLKMQGPYYTDEGELHTNPHDVVAKTPDLAQHSFPYHRPGYEYAVTGMFGGDDTRVRQVITADSLQHAVRLIRDWLGMKYGTVTPGQFVVWTAVEAQPDKTVIYYVQNPEPPHTRRHAAEAAVWLSGHGSSGRDSRIKAQVLPWPPHKAGASAGMSAADLQVVNAHRRMLGIGPIDPTAGWTAAEISAMADSIRRTGRTHNPRAIKRRLLR